MLFMDITIISETKKKLKGSMRLEDILIYSGLTAGRHAAAGVAILIRKILKNRIHSYQFVNERILTVRSKKIRGYTTLLVLHILEDGRKEDSEEFYEILQKDVNSINRNDDIMDFNTRVGNSP